MPDGLTNDLAWIALCVGILAAILAARDLPVSLAVAVAAVRVAIPLAYFMWCSDDLWTDLDDVTYFEQGQELLRNGYNPLSVWLDPEGIDLLKALSNGHHVLYGWWNLLSQYLFGDHYYSAVFLNVLLTFVTAHLMSRIVRNLGFSRGYQVCLHLFLLLHWDILTWSSLLNVKDVLVQTMTVASLYFCMAFFQRRQARYLIAFAAMIPLFYWIRFYVPYVMLIAALMSVLALWSGGVKYVLFGAGAATFFLLLPAMGQYAEYLQGDTFWYGVFRFTLTPVPWRNAEGSYLLIASILHWIMLVPALVGAWLLGRASPLARLALFYLVLVISFYALTEELQGPRQRLQVSFVIAWAQFQFLWAFVPASAAVPAVRAEMAPVLAAAA